MAQTQLLRYFFIAIAIWLALLSFFLVKTIFDWRKLTKSGKNVNFSQIIDSLAREQDLHNQQVGKIAQALSHLEQKSKANFQKMALLRFNPFEDTGGDQSFAIALLDGDNNGIVVSSLHSRNGTRVYAKEVKAGKSTVHQFSKEENEVVGKALRSS